MAGEGNPVLRLQHATRFHRLLFVLQIRQEGTQCLNSHCARLYTHTGGVTLHSAFMPSCFSLLSCCRLQHTQSYSKQRIQKTRDESLVTLCGCSVQEVLG